MHFLIRMALVAAAGAAAWMLAKDRRRIQQEENDPKVVYLSDDDAVIDGSIHQKQEAVPATVHACYRRMNPLTLTGANEAVFLLEDGREVKLSFQGEGGLHMKAGDRGLLTWAENRLILFEMETGEVIGGMFYSPAEEVGPNE